MRSPASTQARDRNAIVISVAAHACALAVLVLLARSMPPSRTFIEAPRFFTVTVERHFAPVPEPIAALAVVQRKRLLIPLIAPIAHTTAVHAPAAVADRVTAVHATTVARVATVDDAPLAAEPPVVLHQTTTPAPLASSLPSAPPSSAPTSAPAAATAAPAVAFGGLFGKNDRATSNPPGALAAIRARIAGHYHIRVAIDPDGHATDVKFVTPMADAALADELRSRLLAIIYLPAECAGLPCSDEIDLRN